MTLLVPQFVIYAEYFFFHVKGASSVGSSIFLSRRGTHKSSSFRLPTAAAANLPLDLLGSAADSLHGLHFRCQGQCDDYGCSRVYAAASVPSDSTPADSGAFVSWGESIGPGGMELGRSGVLGCLGGDVDGCGGDGGFAVS